MKNLKSMQPIKIPPTSPTHYISYNHALNLRFPEEDTGDWHFLTAFFTSDDHPRVALLAGDDEKVNTNPSLGELGVRDMGAVLVAQEVLAMTTRVYVANHYRAIADLAMLDLSDGKMPLLATNEAINQWLDTQEQITELFQKYLLPLGSQIKKENLGSFEQWLKTIQYE